MIIHKTYTLFHSQRVYFYLHFYTTKKCQDKIGYTNRAFFIPFFRKQGILFAPQVYPKIGQKETPVSNSGGGRGDSFSNNSPYLLLDHLNVLMYSLVPWRLVADLKQEGSGPLRVTQEILELKGFSVRQWRSL